MQSIMTLTFSDSENYGALLQAYALKEHIGKDNNCGVINYHNPETLYSQVSGWRKIRSFVWNNTVSRFFRSEIRKESTNAFRKKYIGMTEKCYGSAEELKELNSDTDVFVVGSDQVWNKRNNADDPAYLLSFTDKRKVSYAASFGTGTVDSSYLNENAELFNSFSSISVREQSGADALSDVLGITAPVVLDPVFLLSEAEWRDKLGIKEKCDESGYVLCYIMPGDAEVEGTIKNTALSIAKEKGLKVVILGDKTYRKPPQGAVSDCDCGPAEFVEYIANAKYVVTNSFHGTALSLVMHRNFWTVMKKDSENNRNTRMENILKISGTEARGIYCDIGEKPGNLLEEINYAAVQPMLDAEIETSKRFLSEALN